jgi:hypothetical protein
MNPDKASDPNADVSPGSGPSGSKPPARSSDLGLTERRHAVRPLPVPEAVESDGDTDWATFQALVSDKPKS